MSDERAPRDGAVNATLVCAAGVTPARLSAWRDDLLPAEQAEEMARHVATCPACAARLSDYEQIGAALREQVIPTSGADAWPALHLRFRHERRGLRLPVNRAAWSGAGALVAAALLIALFAGLLAQRAGQRPLASHTPTVSATPTLADWTRVSGYTNVQGLAVAPSDPSVAYQVWIDTNGKLLVRRTDDQGATWRTLTSPYIAHATYPVVGYGFDGFVSPFDARVVYLEVYAHMNDGASSCASNGGGQYPLCRFLFVSTDSGARWQPLSLPVAGLLPFPGPTESGLMGQTSSSSQSHATRLYNMLSGAGVGHLVRSDDGGVTWRLIDRPIFAAGQSLITYSATPVGATVFALTEPIGQPASSDGPPLTIWRSDDAGVTWTNLGQAPSSFTNVRAALVVPNGPPILYTLAPVLGTNYISVQGSVTGAGNRFVSAPDPTPVCKPMSEAATPALLATRDDGSVLLWCGGSIESWSALPSRTSRGWQPVTKAPAINSISNAFMQTLPDGSERLWLVQDDNTGAKVEYATLPR